MSQDVGLFEKIFRHIGKDYIQGQEERFEQQQRNIEDLSALAEKLMKELNEEKEALHGAQIALAEAYAYMQERKVLNPQLEENIRNNNGILEQMSNRMDMQDVKIRSMAARKSVDIENAAGVSEKQIAVLTTDNGENEYDCIDYFDFENHFRGSREAIKNVQRQYIEYFEGRDKVVDLGCGRGEFLELLKECHINAIGVECYTEFAEYCKMKGLNVVEEDALAYLKKQEYVGGIFAGQLIEHLKFNQIVELCELAYDKLVDGGYIIMETPNPMSLAIYTHAFYMDPSHNKPIHPLTMEYFMKKVGFKDVRILFTETSKYPTAIPELKSDGIENIEAFNQAMQEVSQTLFGSQDYAIIGRK